MRVMMVLATGVAVVVATVLMLTQGSESGVGQGDYEIDGPTGPAPDLAGYSPPPGCVLDRIFERDGSVWSEFLDAPIRPVVQVLDDGEEDVFPIKYYPQAVNCSNEAEAVNPYAAVEDATGCGPEPLRPVDGWLEGQCAGRVGPDIPVIGGHDGDYVIHSPLGSHGVVRP